MSDDRKPGSTGSARATSIVAALLWALSLLSVLTWSGTAPPPPDVPLPMGAAFTAETGQPAPGPTLQSDNRPVPAAVDKRPWMTGGTPDGGAAAADLPRSPLPLPRSGDRVPSPAAIPCHVGQAVIVAKARAPPGKA